MRVFQGLPRFSLRCKFTTWLFQVTKNRVLDELRARERRPRCNVTLDDMPMLEVLDRPVEEGETIDAVWRALHELNPDLKMALLLRDVVGLPYNEIADSLEITLARSSGGSSRPAKRCSSRSRARASRSATPPTRTSC